MMKTKLKLHLLLLTLLSLAGSAPAQGTAIGYQGRLNDGGVPATGLYDFTFAVFDAEADGAALGGPIPLVAVPVTNGLFNVRLDFGFIFPGTPRWLGITVRKSGVGEHELLTPRAALLPTPYAIHALRASTVDDVSITVDHFDTGGGAGPTPGQLLSYNGANLYWSDPGAAVGDIFLRGDNGTDAYYNGGNVGIGTSTPAHRLSLTGGPTWTANGWLGAIALPNASAIAWDSQSNTGAYRFGMGHTSGGFYMFRTFSDPGTTASPALYDFMVNSAGNVGIGTIDPTARLQVHGGWDGEQGALQLSGHRPTLRFTGDADSGYESWLLHLGGTGPGNLGFFRRTGPSAWNPMMQLTASGKVEMNGSGIALNAADAPMITRGWDPFSSDAPAGKVGHGRWGLFMEPSALTLGIPESVGGVIRMVKYHISGGFTQLARLDENGNFTTLGTINGLSDRNVKQDFAPVDAKDTLEKVAQLQIATWSFTNSPSVRHVGPVAQDFHAAFAVGLDDLHIATVDADGVALAAIQGLNQKLNEKVTEIRELKARLERLESLMAQQEGGAK